MKTLLVEDDELLGEAIVEGLRHLKHTINWLRNGRSVTDVLQSEHHDAVILDLGLPDKDGMEVLNTLRKTGLNLPVLILTARDQIEDKLNGFESGADDYVVKPFDIRELEARIRALVRRNQGSTSETMKIGRASLNLASHSLAFDGQEISLSRREYPIIELFFRHPDKIFSREKLEDLSYGWGEEVASNTIEVHIHNIRKKIAPGLIKTIRGVGYMLVSRSFS